MFKKIYRFIPHSIFIVVLAIGAFFYFHNLNHEYISQWDEIVHINVAHNLFTHCCQPLLRTEDLGTDYKDWANNFIWLHKPLLPFYFRAFLYHLFGESMVTFRLPSVIFALATAVALFLIAKKQTILWGAVAIVALFVSNSYIFELVQGRQFSDFSDIAFVFLLTLVLGISLDPQKLSKNSTYVLVGVIGALAYFCKGGLVLPALLIFGIAAFWEQKQKAVTQLAFTVIVTVLFAAPEYFYLLARFPEEFKYEQSQQTAHLFKVIESWGRPWDYYITVYFKTLFDVLLVGPIVASIFLTFNKICFNRRNTLLVLWVLAYVIPLSFGISKVSNFIAAIIPAGLLLVGFITYDLWQQTRYKILLTVSLTPLLVFLLPHWKTFDFFTSLDYDKTVGERFLALGGSIAIMLIIGAILWAIPPRKWFREAALVAIIFGVFIITVHNFKANWGASNTLPLDYAQQVTIKETAVQIKDRLPTNAIVLIDDSRLVNAFLYFQYWSGLNALPAKQRDLAEEKLRNNHSIYLLSSNKQKAALIQKVPFGYLYKL